MEIDSVMSTSYKASVLSTLGSLFTIRIAKIRWLAPQNAGDTLLIIDPQDGTELVRLVGQQSATATLKQDVVEDFLAAPKIWRDFQVVQIDSGRCYIHLA